MGVGVSLTRKHVWMFHLNHPAGRAWAKASRKVIKKDEQAGRYKRNYKRGTEEKRRNVSSGNMPRFLYNDPKVLIYILQVLDCICHLIKAIVDS